MKRFALLATAALMVACGDAPTGPADSPAPSFAAVTNTTSVSVPVAIGLFVPCAAGGAGEVVLLSGELHLVFHVTQRADGTTIALVSNPQGVTGTGLTTGDTYRGTGVGTQTLTSQSTGQFERTFVDSFKIIGPGPGNNFLVQGNLHLTVNANGALTADVNNFTVDCK